MLELLKLLSPYNLPLTPASNSSESTGEDSGISWLCFAKSNLPINPLEAWSPFCLWLPRKHSCLWILHLQPFLAHIMFIKFLPALFPTSREQKKLPTALSSFQKQYLVLPFPELGGRSKREAEAKLKSRAVVGKMQMFNTTAQLLPQSFEEPTQLCPPGSLLCTTWPWTSAHFTLGVSTHSS